MKSECKQELKTDHILLEQKQDGCMHRLQQLFPITDNDSTHNSVNTRLISQAAYWNPG